MEVANNVQIGADEIDSKLRKKEDMINFSRELGK
jgi:hypothetical protein